MDSNRPIAWKVVDTRNDNNLIAGPVSYDRATEIAAELEGEKDAATGWRYVCEPIRESDKCSVSTCSGLGVPGNGNIIDGKVVCDYCHAKMRRDEHA